MLPKEKAEQLQTIYRQYETQAAPYKTDAVCGQGCAFCCRHMGDIDAVTLEALVILDHLESLPKPRRLALLKKIRQNNLKKERGQPAPCPFLMKNDSCAIYQLRPFSCRQLYSLARCEGKGATVHRGSRQLTESTVAALAVLDDTGYAGHLTYLLMLLQIPSFCETYRGGGFDPAGIADFGKGHGIRINRMMLK